jgi:hypothetical protein
VVDPRAPRNAALDAQLQAWATSRGMPADNPAALRHGVLTWSRLHGLVSLEIGGNFASLGVDASQLYKAEVEELIARSPRPAH